MLRYEKLTVADEIENALSYYRNTFLRELPALYDDIEDELQIPVKDATYLQMGSWIGGDRDGNPNVNAATMQHALKRQSTTIFDYYLDEVHTLGAEMSISTLMVAASPELLALADASPDHSEHRATNPTAVPSSASTRAWPPRPVRWAWSTSCARKSVPLRPTSARPNAWPNWRCW
jgi:phosphoenolpyruvate carboxylase